SHGQGPDVHVNADRSGADHAHLLSVTSERLPGNGGAASPPVVARQLLRLTSFQGMSLSTEGSLGRPSTRSPRMLRMISEVPPSMVLARLRRKPRMVAAVCSSDVDQAMPAVPRTSTARFWRRWLYSAWKSLVIEPSGPGWWPALRAAVARRLLILITRPS